MDDANDNFMDDLEETQQQTQSTQQSSQPTSEFVNSHLWGYLLPCNPQLARLDFLKVRPRYKIGRNQQANDCVLPGPKISNEHAIITWDGKYDSVNVLVRDISTNGTFQKLCQINGEKIGRNQTRVLREGNEISFGSCIPHNVQIEDYRFIYRHTASGPPTTGLYASYDPISELGRGSYGVVMKAVCHETGEFVAIKMIHKKAVHTPGDRNSTASKETPNREISILEKLKHPNVCELKEVFYNDNGQDINLVLELVEGGDLLEYIWNKHGLSEPESQHITYQLCDALRYIHSQKITHRDLKPENVLLTKDEPPKVKVADFGLAKFVDNMTMLKTMCGTPCYLAPEVVTTQHNNEGYDNLVDSWSVGVIVFSMLTNCTPFVEEDQTDFRTRILTRVISWEILESFRLSSQVVNFTRRLLEIDPGRRMTLTASMQHPWLNSHIPFYGRDPNYESNIPTDDYSMISAELSNDSSFHGSVNEEFQNMHIETSTTSSTPGVPGDYPNGKTSNGLKPQPSKHTPLQRGSLVVLRAEENGTVLPNPPVEMIANAAAQRRRDQEASDQLKGHHKRVHSELTPLPEEPSSDMIEGAGPSAKADDDEIDKGPVPKAVPNAKRGRGRGKANGTSPTKASARLAAKDAENDATPVRRTTRAQKAARRT
ncbi:hypothetical protein H0H93_003512 [Arthromyces matolae]|nr:hypothetical protein H0H93_003512 [Arthromyces matolae]